MKKTVLIAVLLTALFACNNEGSDTEKNGNSSDTVYHPQPDPYSPHPLDTTRRDTTTY